jgi:hypothetical protein
VWVQPAMNERSISCLYCPGFKSLFEWACVPDPYLIPI